MGLMPLTYASMNFTASGVELESDPNEPDEDADLDKSELDSDKTPDHEESEDSVLAPQEPPAEG